MATNNDDIKWLYGKFKAKGYNVGTEQDFRSSLANEADRQWYYEKANGMGLNMGSMADFNSMYAPQTATQPTPQTATQTPATQPTKTQPTAQSGQSVITAEAAETARAAQEAVEKARRTALQAARLEEPPKPTAPQPERPKTRISLKDWDTENLYVKIGVDDKEYHVTTKEISDAGGWDAWASQFEGRPMQVLMSSPDNRVDEYVDLDKVSERMHEGWRKSGGILTEDELAQIKARESADNQRRELEDRFNKAQNELKALMGERERYYGEKERRIANAKKSGNAWGAFLETMGGNRPGIAGSATRVHPSVSGSSAYAQLDKDITAKTAEVAALKEALEDYDDRIEAERLNKSGAGWVERLGHAVKAGMKRPSTWTMGVYDASVNKAAKDADTGTQRGRDLLTSRKWSLELLQKAPMPGILYEVGHFGGEVIGDPSTVLTFGAGGVAETVAKRGVTRAVAKATMKGVKKEAAERLANTWGKRFLVETMGKSANFAVFEGVMNARQQAIDGGWYDSDGEFHEGFSWTQVAKAGGRGAVMGAAMGVFGEGVGQLTDLAVKDTGKAVAATTGKRVNAASAGGYVKAGTRALGYGVGKIGEGTIFAADEIYEFQTMPDDEFDKRYADAYGYAAVSDPQKRAEAREKARNSLSWDAWGKSQLTIAFLNVYGAAKHPKAMIRTAYDRLSELGGRDKREHRTFGERLSMMAERSPRNIRVTKEEREELEAKGYGGLKDLFVKDEVKEKREKPVKPEDAENPDNSEENWNQEMLPAEYAERAEPEELGKKRPELDGYSEMRRLMEDRNVSEATRAKLYFMLTGKTLPMSKVMSYRTVDNEDGTQTVESLNAEGGVVTSRKFAGSSLGLMERRHYKGMLDRQIELNTIDVGERYADKAVRLVVMDEVKDAVAGKHRLPAQAVENIYMKHFRGQKLSDAEMEIVKDVEEMGKGIEEKYGSLTSEAMRAEVNGKYGVDIDKALRKNAFERSSAENEAVKEYGEKLLTNAERQRKANRMFDEEYASMREEAREERRRAWRMQMEGRLIGVDPEIQAEADRAYEESRNLYDRFEQGDPAAQAEMDAIKLRMEEAYQMCDDAFGSEAEYYMFHVNENPWALVDDPELTVEQKDAVLYYINAKAALDGVMDASNEVADRKRAEVEESVAKRTHKTNGVIIPATMKVDDRPVYIVEGDVVMFPDGTAVDVHNSSESLVVMDAQTGEYQFTSPDQIFKVSEAVNPQDELDTALSVIEQEHMNIFGDNAVAPEESADGEEPQQGEIAPFAQPAEAEAPATADTEEYDRGYECGLNDTKNFDDVKLNAEIENLRAYPNGLTDFGRGLLEAYEYEQQRRQMEAQNVPEMPESVPNPTGTPVSDAEIAPEPVPSVENGQQTALSRIPVGEDGEPQFHAAPDKETAWDALMEVTEGDSNAATEIALSQIKQATSELNALKKKGAPSKKAPKLTGGVMAMRAAQKAADENYQKAVDNYNAQVAEAEARLSAWNDIMAVYNSREAARKAAIRAKMDEANAAAHDAAVAKFEEEQRIKAEKQVEQERIGVHAVNPKIKEKWDAAPKVEGNEDALTLPDGSTISGRYVLTEAGAASPSHDANNGYVPTEGFPIDENGQSVNDRDYFRDKDAQQKVEDMAGNYDNRALQDPVIVSKDGVVMSGNNRTMSGDLAARRGTDKAYVDYLTQFGHRKYGFTQEQVTGMKNPRVVFVPDEALPYDATTFARFNAQEKKSQGKPEAAVKLGKIVPDNVFNVIVNDISRYDRLSDYYADEKAVAQALGALMQAGVINDMQMPELRTGTALSAAGKELIENTLIGKVFQASPDAVRQIISVPTLRQSIVMGLSEIANNRTLARNGYDISDELSKAVDLVARAKNAMPDVYTDGMPVSPFGRMQGLFDDEFGDSRVTDATALLLADILNSGRPSDLRKILTTYNNEASQASAGQMDIFSGSIPTKEEILTTVNENFRNATPKEQQALVDAAIAERKRRAEADAEQRERSEASEQTPHDDERRAEPQQPVAGDTELEPLGKDRNDFYEDTPEEAALRARISVGEEWEEEGPAPDKPIYKRKLYVDGKHEVIQTDAPDKNGSYTGSRLTFGGRDYGDLKEIADYIDGKTTCPVCGKKHIPNYKEQDVVCPQCNTDLSVFRQIDQLSDEEAVKVLANIERMQAEPTEAQKAAGNYKMEHRRVDGYNISIENAKGSVRRGTSKDKNGNETPWETVMQNDYGYIRGTEGVDGDHIDVFLSDTPEEGDVFVVDQVNEDGSFDEHKVMYGFPTEQAARDAYLSNYEPGWTGLGAITHVSKDEFNKWIQSSRRKTKPFAEYKSVKPIRYDSQGNPIDENGNLIIEDVKSVADITDADFTEPTRTVGLPTLPDIVQRVLSTNGKKVIIKKNIFERNALRHDELTPEVSRAILNEALYNPTLYGKNKPLSRPNNWIVINVPDGKGNNKLVVLEVNENKDNVEIVHWHEVDNRGLEKIKRQAEREDGQLLILPSESSEEAGALSGPTLDSPKEKLSPSSEMRLTEAPSESEGPDLVPTSDNVISTDRKVNTLSADKQTESAESSEPYTITPTTYTNKKGKTSNVHLVKFNRELTAEEKAALDTFAREPLTEGKKTSRGWYDRKQGGYMMRSEEAARQLAEIIGNEEAVADAQPMTAEELREAVAPAAPAEKKPARKPKKAPINRVSLEDVMTDLSTKGETKLSDHAEPVKAEPEQQHEISDDEMKSLADELRDLLGIGDDEGDTNIKFRDPGELTAQERQRIQSAGIRFAMGLIERGTTAFPDYATKMVGLLGDKIRPWLKSFYEGARWTPGYDKYTFTPTEQVATFDVQNFDKKQADPIAQAAMIVEERKASTASAQAQKELTETRNKKRRENEKQTETDTAALAEKAEAVAGEAEVTAQSAGTGKAGRKRILRDLKRVDDTLEEVNDQLALLGYYEAEEVDKDFNEAYGYMRNAEKKAVKDAVDLAKQLVNDLGLGLDKVTGSTTANRGKRKNAVTANIAPAGGDISIRLPLNEGRELYITIGLDPSVTPGDVTYSGDNLQATRIMYRVEWPDEKGHVSFDRMGRNCWADANVTYADLLNGIQREAKEYLPFSTPAEEPAKAEPQEGAYHGTVTLKDGREAVVIAANHVQNIGEEPKLTDYIVGVKGEPGTIKIKPDEIAHAGAPTEEDRVAAFPDPKDKTAVDDWLYNNSASVWKGVDLITRDAMKQAQLIEMVSNRDGRRDLVNQVIADWVDKWISDHFDTFTKEHLNTLKAWTDYGQREIISDTLAERIAKQTTESAPQKTYNGYKIGDEVMWDRYGNGKWEKQRIIDFDAQGHPIFDSFGQSWITEVGDWERIKPVDGVFGEAKRVARVNAEKKAATQSAVDLLRGDKKSKKKSVSSQKKPEVKPEQPIGGLFGGLFDNEPDNERTEVGTGSRETGGQRQQLKQDTQVGGDEPRRETERPAGEAGSGSTGMDSDADRAGGRGLHDVATQPALERLPEKERKNVHNNHVERGTEVAPKSESARIKANIAAIETMKRLMESGEAAKPADMKKLRAYSGWGGLGSAFTDPATSRQLKGLLGEQDYNEGAEMSRNSAYFTPAYIVDTMWDLARLLGFKGGRMLEGSAGIGNILGLMPQDFAERTNIRAIEKDPTTGAMLRLLYPDSDVDIDGFEKVKLETGGYDLVMTNVPFVPGLKIVDTSGDGDISKRFHTAIHDFCIAKGVRKLRDGGIGIFISTAGSMDATGKLYEWLNTRENADIIGLFRMHRDTFGGTNATTDIILVRKRVNGVKSPLAIDCGLNTGVRVAEYDTGETNKNGDPIIKRLPMSYNRYLVEHPEYVAGEMRFGFEEGDTFRQESKGCYPVKEKDQPSMLQQWVADMAQRIAESPEEVDSTSVVNHREEYVPTYDKVGNEVKTGTIVIDSQGHVCVNYDGTARPLMSTLDKKNPKSEADRIAQFNKNKVKGRTRVQVVQDYNAIKKALNELLEFQKTSESDEGLKPKLAALNRAFDQFVATYGHLHGNNGLSWLRNDVDYPSVFALETYREEGLDHKPVFGKADIFTRRVVVRPEQPKATTVRDGVTLSIRQNGVLDTRFIAVQLGKSEDEVKREVIEAGLGYENPLTHVMEAAHEYLSGNVREKLHQAETNNEDGRYSPNITALRKVVPHDIPSHFIEFSIGSSWMRPEIFEEYIKEKTGTNVKCTYAGGMWDVDIPRYVREQDKAFGIRSEICDKVITGSELIAAAMTNRTIRVTKTQKDGPNINDPKATSACAAKVDEIRDDFKSWLRGKMQANPELANEIEVTYNDIFNNSAPMTIPDEYVPEYFDGAARSIGGKNIKMRKHQSKAIVRGTMQSLMLAHEVGTGKTFTLITTAMEMRRLGTAKKPMIVVQNATLGQFVASAKALYPDARILSLDDKDRNAEGRKDFYAKIRYNDWDMVVIPQSVLERIPDHPDRERRFIEEAIEEKMEVIEAMSRDREQSKAAAALKKEVEKLNQRLAEIGDADKTTEDEVTGERIMAPAKGKKKDGKKAAITKENAKTHAEEMLNRATDNTLNFDDLGVDAILVDEAHEYKHLGFATAMQRGVKGVDPSYSKKCQGLYLKVKAVQEKSGGRNVIFATGTPISNTAAEIWTFMRYLLPREVMEGHNIWHFDDFVRNFGSIQQMLEFTTAGSYKENNRFAGYTNLPELARIWAGIADTVLTEEAGEVKKQIPELEGGKPTDIYLPQTNGLRAVLKYVRAQLKAYEEMSGQEKKENSHIPLVMYGIAKAAAIDARLVMPNAPDDPHSKTNEAVRQTLRSLKDSEKYNGTVAIFADNYQRKNKDTGAIEFNLFEDIRDKLIAQGVPAEQIVIMRDGMTDKKKEKIFAQVNAGEVRVILGTTQRLGVGVNIQERLHTLMHIDAPNRPMDYWQRMGRLLRQGNLHKEMGIPVRVIRFGVEDSLDVTAYQRLKTKGAIADAIMHSKALLANNLDNRVLEEEGDEFGNITAELSGSQYAMLLNQAEKELRKLLAAQDQHRQHQMYIHRAEPRLRETIERMQAKTERSDEILALLESNPKEIRINGKTYKSRNELDKVYEAHNKSVAERKKQAQTMDYDKHIKTELTFQVGELLFGLQSDTYHGIVGYGSSGAIDGVIVRQKLVCPQLDIDQEMGDVALKRIINVLFDEVLSGKQERTNREGWVNAKERAEIDLAQILKDKGKPFEHRDRIAELQQKVDEYSEAMQEELKEKEAKYAEMDANIEDATDITFTSEDDEDEDSKGSKSESTGDGNKYRLVAERELLDFLDAQPLKKGYRYSQWANMGVLPPMTAKQNGEWRAPMIFSRWEQSEEGMRKENGKADLVQGNGRTTGDVAYNPYFHIRTSPLNDQFTAAYDRPELLVVEGYYPESEETSGYQAEGAKDSVGLMDWHSGSVNGQLSDDTKVQTMLSRYFKPGRIVPWSEVADLIMERVGNQKITFPINAVPPMLRAELAKRGAKFGDISGSVAEADIPMLNELRDRVNAGEWDAGLEKARAYLDAYESSTEAKEARVADLSARANTPVRIVRTQEEADALPTRRERRAKGWWSAKDDEVVIVLPNNVNVADVDNTFVHEVAGHKGLRAFIGEERFDEFLGEIYDHASNPIRKVIDKMTDRMVSEEADRLRTRKAQAHERAGEDANANYYTDMAEARVEADKKREDFRKEATEEYMSDLGGRIGSEGFEKMSRDELTLWGKIKAKVQAFLDKFLQGLKIAKSIRLNDTDLSYILYKSWKNLRKKGVFADAEDTVVRRRTGYDADEVTRFRDPGLGLEETITKMKAEAMQANAGNLQAKRDAMRAIGGNLNHLRQAMARQREYDITTVKSVADLARVLMDNNLLDDLSKYETKRILGAINNVVGKQDVSQYVQKVMDIMVDNQLRMGANTLGRLLSIRGSRVDARGIEVQGELDPDGQRIAQVVRKSTSLPKDDIDNRIAEAINRMSSTDQAIADEATIEYAGLQIASQYVEDITESKAEEKALRDSIREAKEAKDAGQMTEDAYRQYVESTEDAIRQNKIERAEAFNSLVEQVGGVLSESVERAKAWREAEKQRVEEIHHNANSDMEGRPTDEHHKDDRMQKMANNSFARFLLSPLATFDQMLRMFGKKNSRGEGYLWNRYMRDWVTATEKEYTGYRDALKVLDAKVSEIYGKDMTWGDLFTIDRKLPKASVRFFDGGEMKEHELTQGNLLYIYMADKMSDGRMKLRRMGITEEDIEDIKNFLDPKFMQLADWMQEEFLVDKRNEYNEVHKRMFGASMAAIENYFPLKILANARLEDVDVADDTTDTALPATSTGSIIKRRRNNLALDVTGANAFSVILDHLQQMERWAAFAEFNRDLNTLLSYKRFRNQVMNMSSVYGAGKTLWNNFRNVCSMAAGAYRPPIAALDKSAVNIAKGVTAAKVSFRVFTALKQFLSMPAYASDSNPMYLAANIANPIGAWRWSMENLPLFEKRWRSRMAGDPRLLKSDMDWKMWRSRVVELASRVGMAPNAFVDALTVAIGAHAMYQTKLAKYKRQGYDPHVAEERAKQDATVLFNQTQQSSEGAFLSTMQVDRSWLSVLFTVFRNSSMSYTRQLYDSIRNIGRRLTPGYKALSEEFMAKQMRRDGIDPDKADRNAKQEYRRGIIRDLVRVGIFGYVLQLAWNMGAYLPYLFFGDDDDEKDKMWDDVFTHTMFGSIEGLTGGDVYSNTLNAWAKGEQITPWVASKDMPLASDLENIWTKWNTDEVSAMNDVINLLVQSGVGVNPQSLTDAVVAVMDVCGDDAQTSRECALLMARVINCPQSQLDKIYFDELGATGEEASQMTPYEIAERYARYKVRRGAPLTGWAYGNEQREKIMDKYRKKSNTLAKERLTRETDTQASPSMTQWLEEFEATKDRVSDIKKVKSRDEDRYYELLDELEATPEFSRYEIIRAYKHDVDELTKEWLNARTAAQRDSCSQAILTLKREMVRELSDTQQ